MNTAESSNQSLHPNNKALWNSRITWLTALSALAVVVIYIFFISVGTWTKWPTTTDFYAQLARAFDHGQVSLLTKPDPSILACKTRINTMSFASRRFIYGTYRSSMASITSIGDLRPPSSWQSSDCSIPSKQAINMSSSPPPADYFLSTSCCSSDFGNASSPTCRCGHLKSSSCLWDLSRLCSGA